MTITDDTFKFKDAKDDINKDFINSILRYYITMYFKIRENYKMSLFKNVKGE